MVDSLLCRGDSPVVKYQCELKVDGSIVVTGDGRQQTARICNGAIPAIRCVEGMGRKEQLRHQPINVARYLNMNVRCAPDGPHRIGAGSTVRNTKRPRVSLCALP